MAPQIPHLSVWYIDDTRSLIDENHGLKTNHYIWILSLEWDWANGLMSFSNLLNPEVFCILTILHCLSNYKCHSLNKICNDYLLFNYHTIVGTGLHSTGRNPRPDLLGRIDSCLFPKAFMQNEHKLPQLKLKPGLPILFSGSFTPIHIWI